MKNSNQLVKTIALGTLAIAVSAGLFNPVLAQEKVQWKVQSVFNTSLPGLGDMIVNYSKMMSETTGGRIRLKIYEPGAIVPPLEITPSIGTGSLPAAYNYLGYDQGRIPSAILFAAVPFGMEPWESIAWWHEGGGRQLAEEIYHAQNVHPVLCNVIGPETAGWFTKPINSLKDMQGLKIRFSGLGGMVMNKIGASATLIPGGEIFQALERGTIDATEFSMPAIDNVLGFYKIAKYNLFPGWHQPSSSIHLIINLDSWNGLSKSDQALFEMACEASTIRSFVHAETLQGPQIQKFKEQGVTTAKLPDTVIESLRKATSEVMQEEAAKDETFARVWKSQKEFSAKYRVWRELGYLDRN